MKPTLGPGVPIGLAQLLAGRLLLTANSGGGKSWALRRLLEQTHGLVQQLVIDPEDEFVTLRERHNLVLAAPRGGDVVADPRSAPLLARKLLELRVSAVLAIYELQHHQRIAFVKGFLDALVNAPKELWCPVLVIVDEAHNFCPESGRGHGECASSSSVIDLMSRGRKRGFAGVLATQRLSKLHKDAAAEAVNKLVGRINLDLDVARAAGDLGFAKGRWPELKALEPGHFFAVGPALAHDVTLVKVGDVRTTHPEPGQGAAVAPPPPEKIRAILGELADLPKEAEEEARTLGEAKAAIRRLEGELRAAKKAAPPPPAAKVERVEVSVVKPDDLQRLDAAVKAAEKTAHALLAGISPLCILVASASKPATAASPPRAAAPAAQPAKPAPRARAAAPATAGNGAIGEPEQRIIDTLAMLQRRGIPATVETLARWMGLHPKGGTFRGQLRRLRERGYLDDLTLTDAGRELVRDLETGVEAAYLAAAMKRAGRGDVLREIVSANGEGVSLSVESLAARLGVHPKGGTYRGHLRWLRQMGVIPQSGAIVAAEGVYR